LKIRLKTTSKLSLFLCLLCLVIFMISCKGPEQKNALADLAQTPPMGWNSWNKFGCMGWNSWNKFGCDVDENMIKEMADAMVSSGMRDAGYEFIVIDDCWQISRDSEGNIVEDSEHFPSGIKALADYVHSEGLKFGLYSCAGTKTCAGRPGSKGYEEKDAMQYAAWGVDYLKFDWCNTKGMDAKQAYTKMRKALEAAGRPIVFSMCEWGTNLLGLYKRLGWNGLYQNPGSSGGFGGVCWSRALERPGYAGSWKRRDEYHRIQSPFQSVVSSGSASHGRKRSAQHVR
jgi:alpha-galactosidase